RAQKCARPLGGCRVRWLLWLRCFRAGPPGLAEALRAAMAVSGHLPSLGPVGAIKNRNTTLSHWLMLICWVGWHMQRSSCHVRLQLTQCALAPSENRRQIGDEGLWHRHPRLRFGD